MASASSRDTSSSSPSLGPCSTLTTASPAVVPSAPCRPAAAARSLHLSLRPDPDALVHHHARQRRSVSLTLTPAAPPNLPQPPSHAAPLAASRNTMTDPSQSMELNTPLNLTPEEKRVFGELFRQADTEQMGVVTGEVAVKFFERTKLPPQVLGEIWQIADTENRGLLTSSGFCQVLRLIGHYQAGKAPTPELAFQPGPLPKFDTSPPSGAAAPGPITPQMSGPIRVPPLTPDRAAQYATLFDKSGAVNGVLPGTRPRTYSRRQGYQMRLLAVSGRSRTQNSEVLWASLSLSLLCT
ncbi:hypothetical protein B0J12DRAFT_378350 [Macrophomina phaseolina]|uniref:EH domain-containing protein n=1 Tax=Macrophomina phaseolina TaxID=35725 RepID=A0ABQ8GKI6_9PEZI|nr:hypothetical protein B0J12DRAFT_378350 [Macrophomina phaseolina]